ncbi:MAG TPA: transcription antitermination factor NusB [Polyangiaceae bacterium]|nr:transcription antitermination factor NusB [Polyangiaceae bacterium]
MAAHKPAKLPTAREIAARILLRVRRDGAFAAAALDAELGRLPQLDPRERALATELVYGCLRTEGALRAEIDRYARHGISDDVVLVELLIAVYQLVALSKVPEFAAVDAAVSAVRRQRGPKVAGFANAVLRKVARSGVRLEDAVRQQQRAPEWLCAKLTDAVGAAETEALLSGETPTTVRVREGRSLPEWLLQAPPGRASPLARRAPGGDPRQLPGYDDGAFVIQEEGAQVVALALGARPGERVLDACAGRGQKTSLLADRVGPTGKVFASDLYPAKLDALAREFQRLELPPPEIAAVDLTVGSGPIPTGFDRALVDAPCTGTGTLRRRPEILRRLEADDPGRLAALQRAILRTAASRVRPGGRVLYAVCSVLPEEGEAVVAAAGDLLTLAPFDAPELAPLLEPTDCTLRLLPGRHGTDGFFLASLVRR